MPVDFCWDSSSAVGVGVSGRLSPNTASEMWAVGTVVVTLYGTGPVLSNDATSGMHKASATLRHTTHVCTLYTFI